MKNIGSRTGKILQNSCGGKLFSVLFLIGVAPFFAQENNPLKEIMRSEAPKIKQIAKQLDQHQVQLLYVAVNSENPQQPKFKEYRFQQEDSLYFYPASTVKLPIAVLAMEKLNQLNAQGISITRDTPFI